MEILQQLFSFEILLIVFSGTLLGVVAGMLPGLNGAIGVTLLLPFTFTLDISSALLLLGGIYMGSSYGGSISAILLNAPGSEMAAATSLDGYPMMQQGRGEEALHYALLASALGGFFGLIGLIFFTPMLAKVALSFGPPELALLAIAGLALIGILSGREVWLGIGVGSLGVLLSTIGQDIMLGQSRNSFGFLALEGGLGLVPVLVGLFALSEVIAQVIRPSNALLTHVQPVTSPISNVLKNVFKKYSSALTKGSFIGLLIGVMPGAGAAIATFIAYGEAKRSSKKPHLFGHGNPEGIIAAESANNSAVCASLVPLLALGIPGSTTCAIMYGALALHGIIPGPRLMQTSGDFVYVFMFGMGLTVICMLIIGYFGISVFSKLLKIPLRILMPCIFILCLLGSFSISNSMFNIGVALIFGIIGFFFKWVNIPVAPLVLGLILGPLAEEGIRQSFLIANAQNTNIVSFLLARPISFGLIVVLLIIIYAAFISFKRTCAMSDAADCNT